MLRIRKGDCQAGFAHVLVFLLMLAGIGLGVYLVQTTSNFNSKAQISQSTSEAVDTSIDPQYLVVNKAETEPLGTCCWWSGYYTDRILKCDGSGQSSEMDCSAYTNKLTAVDEIRDSIFGSGAYLSRPDAQNNKRRLAVSFTISYLNNTSAKIDQLIANLTTLSQQKDMPIVIKLDGYSWWDSRSDLWNWFDSKAPGYNPDNRKNVEWTSWSNASAISKSWRNWGREIEVKPHPNLGSPVYIQAKQAELRRIIPQIARWYKSLPADKKYLLAGVVLDWELSVGVNYYYYLGGVKNSNSLLDLSKGPSFGMQQLGYAAVSSYGIKTSGELTITDLNEVIRRHSQMLSQTVREAALQEGVDLFSRTYVHGGGNSTVNYQNSFAYEDVLTNWGKGGWSFYNINNPSDAPGLSGALDKIDNTAWGAVEWNIDLANNQSQGTWEQSLNNTFNYRNNRLINIYNWEGIIRNTNALSALKNVLTQAPSCLVGYPKSLTATSNGQDITFSWQPGQDNQALYLNVSTSRSLKLGGNLQNANIVNEVVSGKTLATKYLNAGTYYWNVTADGCSPVQRRISETYSLTVGEGGIISDGTTPAPTSWSNRGKKKGRQF